MKSTNPHRILSWLASVTALLLLSAQVLAQDTPVRGGKLNVGMEGDWATLDPLGMGAQADRHVGRSIYDTLLEFDEKGRLIPGLAESFTVSPDALSYRLTLRSGVKFHDGTPFNAAAVVFNIKRLMDPRCRCAADLAVLDNVIATGPMEVEFRMKNPSAQFGAMLADVPGMMVSPAAVEKFGKDYGANPVGTGPFVFKEWRRGNYLHAVRNANYWRDGKPYLDEVFYRPMPDEQTRIAALRTGDIDVGMVPAPKDVADALKNKSLSVVEPPSTGSVFVMFQTKTGPLADPRVRAALAYATDRIALNRAINRGVFKVARTPFGSGLAPHEKVDGYPEFDLKKAQAIVKEIGAPIKIKFSTWASPLPIQTAQALQQMWMRAGIDVEIHQVEVVQIIRDAIAHNFEAALFRWSGGGDPDLNVYKFFHSKANNNYVQYANPQMDKLLDAGRASADEVARVGIYAQVSSLLAKDVPYLFLYYYTPFMLSAKNVHGIPKVVDGILRPVDVWKTK